MATNWNDFTPIDGSEKTQAPPASEPVNWDDFTPAHGASTARFTDEGEQILPKEEPTWSEIGEGLTEGAIPMFEAQAHGMTVRGAQKVADEDKGFVFSPIERVKRTTKKLGEIWDKLTADYDSMGERVAKTLSIPGDIKDIILPDNPENIAISTFRGMLPDAAKQAKAAEKHALRKYRQAQAEAQRARPEGLEDGSLKYHVFNIGNAMINMAPMIVSSAVTRRPKVGMALMGLQVYGDTYGSCIAEGRGEDECHTKSMLFAASEAGSEYLPIKYITSAGGKYLSGILKAGAAEGVQETLNQAFQIGYEYSVEGKKLSMDEIWRQMRDSAIAGAGAGASFRSITGIPVAAKERQLLKADKRVQEAEAVVRDIWDRVAEAQRNNASNKETLEQELREAADNYKSAAEAAFDAYEIEQEIRKIYEEERGFEEIEKGRIPEAAFEGEKDAFPEEPDPKKAIPEEPVPATAESMAETIEKAKKERDIQHAARGTTPGPLEAGLREIGEQQKYGLNIEEAEAATETQPTDAQIESGNYKKGKVKIAGMQVAIENPRGSVRKGTDQDGETWEQTMQNPYGYIQRTEGADGEHVDVFLGPQAETAETVHVVNQVDPATGKFDEHKVIMGAASQEDAATIYKANYAADWKGLGSVVEMPMDEFKSWLKTGDTAKPIPPREMRAIPEAPEVAVPRETVPPVKKRPLLSRKAKAPVKPAPKVKPKAFVGISPAVEEGIDFNEARGRITSDEQRTAYSISDDVYQKLGIDHTVQNAIGDWADGAENSMFIEIPDAKTPEALEYAAALQGKFFNQKGVLSFVEKEGGKDFMYTVDIPITAGNIENIRSTLDDFGIQFRTLVPEPNSTKVVIYDEGAKFLNNIAKFGEKYGIEQIEAYQGEGQLIGSWESREEGIRKWEDAGRARYVPEPGLRDYWGTGYQEQARVKPAAPVAETLASPVPLYRLTDPKSAQQDVYGRFAKLTKKDTTEDLKIYNLDPLIADTSLVDSMLDHYGYTVKYFAFHEDPDAGVEFTIPKLKKQGYKQGVLWIYDPRVAHGSFKDVEYTRQWRIVHELAHAITEKFMEAKYGPSRREGRLGRPWMAQRGKPPKQVTIELDPLTLKQAQRAVKWEDVAFRVQRFLMEELGIKVDPVDFAREYNTNIGDAIYRVLTGDFGDPGEYGVVPNATLPPLKSVLKMLENTEKAMAKEQGRKPSEGIDLTKWKRTSEAELRAAMKKQVAKDAPQLRREADKGADISTVKRAISHPLRQWKNAPEVVVVDDHYAPEVPKYLADYIDHEGAAAETDALFDPNTGKVYLFASRISNAEHAQRALFHEVLGHYALRQLMGKKIEPVLRQIYMAKQAELQKVAEAYGLNLNRKTDQLVAAEEWLAEQAESNPRSSWVQRALSLLKQWARAIFPRMKMTDSEIIGLMGRMKQKVREGKIRRYEPGKPMASIHKSTGKAVKKMHNAKAASQLAKFFRRNFTKEGLLGSESFEAKIKADALKKVGEEDVAFLMAQFTKSITKAFGVSRYNQISETDLLKVDAYLHGRDVYLPLDLKTTLDAMRGYLDQLSKGVQKSMKDMLGLEREKLTAREKEAFNKYLKGDPEGWLPAGIQKHFNLYQTIAKNMGTYVTRSYEAFDNPKWKTKVLEDTALIEEAEGYIRERNPDFTDAEVTGAVRAILQTAKEKGNFFSFLSGGVKYGKKDVSIITKRKDVPPVIRRLLGQYKDPRVNFANTATKMYSYIGNHHFLMEVRRLGLNTFLFERPTNEFDTQIAGEGSETMNPLNGLYTTEDFVIAMQDLKDVVEGGHIMKTFIRLNSAIKYGKTILAPTTQARNFMSAAMFAVMNGHFNMSYAKQAALAAKSDLFTHELEFRRYLNKLIKLGVLHDNPRAEELRRAINDFIKMDIYKKGATQPFRRLLDFMQRTYQIGDDFWKIIGYENELAMQLRAGLSQKEAEQKAAYRIRNGYPTYSMVPRAIRWIRRAPLIGTFVSFPYEIVRTSANQVRFLKEDVTAGNAEMAARRALGMTMATAASATLSALSMSFIGIDDEDDEAIRLMAPPWSRNSQLVYTGYDEDGNPTYIDFSYYDPYTYLKKPVTAIMSGNNKGIDKKIVDALIEFLEPFAGTDIAAEALVEIYANKKRGTGQPVWNENDTIDDIAVDMVNHFRKAAQPGVLSNVERIAQAATGEVTRSGKEYKLTDEMIALVGWRMTTTNIPQSLYYRTLEFQDAKKGAVRKLSFVVGDRGTVTESDMRKAFNDMKRARDSAYNDMIKIVAAAQKLGVPSIQIRKVLKSANVKGSDINRMLRGEVPRWRPSSQFMDSARERVRATAKKEDVSEVQEMMFERERFVRQLARED